MIWKPKHRIYRGQEDLDTGEIKEDDRAEWQKRLNGDYSSDNGFQLRYEVPEMNEEVRSKLKRKLSDVDEMFNTITEVPEITVTHVLTPSERQRSRIVTDAGDITTSIGNEVKKQADLQYAINNGAVVTEGVPISDVVDAMVAAGSDLIDIGFTPIRLGIQGIDYLSGGRVGNFLNDHAGVVTALMPSSWYGPFAQRLAGHPVEEHYLPWDPQNPGFGSYEANNVFDTALMMGLPISKLRKVKGPIVADIGKQVIVTKPWDGTFTMDDVVKKISKPRSQNTPMSPVEILFSSIFSEPQTKYVVKQRLPTNLHYRQVGSGAIDDLLESGTVRGSGTVRAGYFPVPFFSHGKLYMKKPTRSEYLLSMIPENVRIKLDNAIQKITKKPFINLFTNHKINMARGTRDLIVGKEMPGVKYMPIDNGGLVFGIDKDAGIRFPITEGLEQTTPIYNGSKNALPLSKVDIYTFDPITGQYVNYNLYRNLKLAPQILGGATVKELNNEQEE